MVIASSKKHIMQNIFIYLTTPTDAGNPSFPRVLKIHESGNFDSVVPYGHVPFMGYFDDDGILCMTNQEKTQFRMDELLYELEGEEFEKPQFEPKEYVDCIAMVPIRLLNEKLGIVIQTGEGWGWNEQTLQNEFCERPDGDHIWNPYSKKYDKRCQCGSGCLDFLIGKSLYERFHISDLDVFCNCQICPFCNKYHDWICREEDYEIRSLRTYQ